MAPSYVWSWVLTVGQLLLVVCVKTAPINSSEDIACFLRAFFYFPFSPLMNPVLLSYFCGFYFAEAKIRRGLVQPLQAESRDFGERLQYRPPRLDPSRVSIVLVNVWLHRGTISAAVVARRGESSFGPHPCIPYFFL